MSKVDLDALEEMVSTFAPEGWVRHNVPPLTAELRAARVVVEATRKYHSANGWTIVKGGAFPLRELPSHQRLRQGHRGEPMTRSAIATTRKKPQTPGQRLAALDPDLAKQFDEWEADLNREYDLAFNDHPAPPILDAEEALAFELGRFHLAADPFLEVADKLREDRDAAYMVLGRVEHLIAQRTLEALQLTPQAALPAPLVAGGGNGGDGDPNLDDDDDWGDPTEDYRFLRADPEPTETGPDGLPVGTPPWDDPEGATIAKTVERPRASMGHGPKWWARITRVSLATATIVTGVVLAGWTLLQQAHP